MTSPSTITHFYASNNDKTTEHYPTHQQVYPDLKEIVSIGSGPIRKAMLLLLLLFAGAIGVAYAQTADNKNAIDAYKQLFEETNVGNLHIYSLTEEERAAPDDFFYGQQIPRGLFGLFSANWRDELPADFEAYALFKIKHGEGDAYLMRFAGPGTQNLIGLFTIKGDKVAFLKVLSSHSCNQNTCWQTDSWIQDFDGDTRLDILQKVRVLQFTLMDAPVEEYSQVLRQGDDGKFTLSKEIDIDIVSYRFADAANNATN